MMHLSLILALLPAAAPASAESVAGLSHRLAALDGRSALDYFLLAEEVMSERNDAAGRRLARSLLVVSHEIDRASPRSEPLAPSICLALASIAEQRGEREWLLALAGREPDQADHPSGSSGGAVLVADALLSARESEPREVKELLASAAAAEVMDQLKREHPAARLLLERALTETTCTICHNRRTQKSNEPRPAGGFEEVHTLCPECRGNPGPRYADSELAQSMHAASSLLDASQASWSAQCWLDRAAPLREPDPDELASFYAVEPGARLWRDDPASSDPAEGTFVKP